MSEYQYYEFQAIDRPLTAKEMSNLRARSSRATITPTCFVNEYAYGSFRGDADGWMARYFDAFLHVASWGTRVLKLRLPSRALPLGEARRYCVRDRVSIRAKSGHVILSFSSGDDEEGRGWVDGEGLLSSIVGVRAELARGDRRALYLAWLACVQSGDVVDREIEPPVPAGLRSLSAALESLVDFLRIAPSLVDAASAASPARDASRPRPKELRTWLGELPAREKDALLARLVTHDADEVRSRLLRMYGARRGASEERREQKRRTVGALRRAAV